MRFLPSDIFLKISYEYYTGKKLDLENPKEFNEKIQWLKLNYRPSILNQLVDKFEVKKYISAKIGSAYLNSTLGIYKHFDDIDFDKLPQKFILKATHACRNNLIVYDKNELDKTEVKKLITKWLNRNYYSRSNLEWAYKDVQPRIIAEPLLTDNKNEVLNDYKFFCFNGEPKFLQLDIGRGINHSRSYYDMNWSKLSFGDLLQKTHMGEVEEPKNLKEMIRLARILAKPFPFVRVDFYSIKGKTIFGEMTFYPGDIKKEFTPSPYNKIIGDYLNLPKLENNQIIN